MPVQYQIPPWVRGADPIGKRLQAYAIGLQAAQAQARLAIERQQLQHQANQMAQQAQQEQMRLQIAQQEQERKRAHDDQQLEVLKEYHRQQGDLRQLQLSQEEQKIKYQSEAAAQKASSMLRMSQRIAAGEDPVKVALEEGPGLGGATFSNALRVSRMPKPIIPGEAIKAGTYTNPFTGEPIKNWVNVPSASGTGTHPMKVPSGEMEPAEARRLLDTLQFSDKPDDQALIAAARSVIQKSAGIGGAGSAAPLPYPKSEADIVEGQAYVTKAGPATWNKETKRWMPVASATPESALPDYAQLPGEGPEGDSAPPEPAAPAADEQDAEPNLFDETE